MNKKFPWLTGYQWIWILYILIAVFCWQLNFARHRDNNYLIFREAFYHLTGQLNMYAAYPAAYDDFYYYGPIFGLFMAPFALLSHYWGEFLWAMSGAIAMLIAVDMLPVTTKRKTLLLLLCAIEFANCEYSLQFNATIAAFIIISFLLVEKGKDEWATLLIVLGALMKLYPVVGLVFFLFSKNKSKFIISAVVWFAVLLVFPMLFSGKSFIISSYHHWFEALSYKNMVNHRLSQRSQDICIMGIVRDFTQNAKIPDLPFLIFGAVAFVVPLFRFSQFKSYQFRVQILATALIMLVLFSTGAESPTYIIAVAGIFLWMMTQEQPFTPTNITLIVFLLVVTGLGLSDAMPQPVRRDVIGKYGIKAWPCIAAWLIITYELFFKDFTKAVTGGTKHKGDYSMLT